MRLRITVLAVLASSLALFAFAGMAGASGATTASSTELKGRITSVDRSGRTFRLQSTSRGTIRIRVTSATRWDDDLGGHFSALRKGLRVEVRANRVNGQWRATKIDREDSDDD